jgi:NAD dependent epimerase/dehydratase family enzyme
MREFCRELGQALHRPSWLPVPGFALRAALGEMAAELVLGGQRVIPRKLGASGFRFNYPGVARALAACIAERGGAG